MTNYEYYKKDIEKLARFGIEVALKKDADKIVPCTDIACDECLFHLGTCADKKLQWADEEYAEPEVDWSKVPVDTKIWVRDSKCEEWVPRYFAKYENGVFGAWNSGATSFSAEDSVTNWKYAKLAEEVENDG